MDVCLNFAGRPAFQASENFNTYQILSFASRAESDVLVRVPEGQAAEVGMLVDVLPIG